MNFGLTLAAQMNEKNADQWSASGGVEIPTCFIAYQVTTVQSFYIFQVNVTKVDMVWWYLS